MAGKQPDLSTEWSPWAWSDEWRCHYSSRYGPDGRVEYRYPSEEENQQTPRYAGEASFTQYAIDHPASPSDATPGYTTSIPSRSNVTKTTKITLPDQFVQDQFVDQYGGDEYGEQTTSPPHTSSYDYPQDTDDLAEQVASTSLGSARDVPFIEIHAPAGQTMIAKRITDSGSNNTLNERYKMIDPKNKKFWKPGRVFMVLWTEPARSGGTGGSQSQYNTVWLGEPVFSEIRRFVVIGDGYGNAICSPIHTYGGRATLKENLPDPQQHAIIYTSPKSPPPLTLYDSEGKILAQEFLPKDPIRVIRELDHEDGDLGTLSRINYAKIYTVEKYVRVQNIGRVHEDSMESLLASCFFARPADQPVQGPKKHRTKESRGHDNRDKHGDEKRDDKRDDRRDDRGQSSRSGGGHHHHRRK